MICKWLTSVMTDSRAKNHTPKLQEWQTLLMNFCPEVAGLKTVPLTQANDLINRYPKTDPRHVATKLLLKIAEPSI